MSKKEYPGKCGNVRKQRILSFLLTGFVRLIFGPFTLLYTLLVFLWSLPFRLFQMYVRAKHPFLCADSLERFLDQGDPAVGFWDLYCCFRHNGLSRTDSLFNSYYIRLTERVHRERKVCRAPEGIPNHPFGWYSSERVERPSRPAAFGLRVVSFLPRLLLFLPKRAVGSMRKFSRAMENSQTAIGGAARFLHRRFSVLVPLFLLLVVGGVIGYYSSMPLSFSVRVDGETIGYVESRQELTEAIRATEAAVSDALGTSFKIPQNISYSISKTRNPDYLSKTQLVEALSAYTSDYVRVGYALYVDGRLAVASESEGELRALLEEALSIAQQNMASEDIALLNDTRILYQSCPVDSFLSAEKLRELLLPLSEEGEGSTVVELSAYEPSTVPTARALGDGQAYCYTLNYAEESEEEDALKLVYGCGRIEEEVQSVNFNITYRESDTVYEGAQYVYQKGVMGEKLISYTVYYSGETEYSREVLSEATLKDPIDQIVLIGTKPLPFVDSEDASSAQSGRVFISPVYGDISSYFGLRDMDDDGVLESGHSGIDIPATYGTPLYAAGSGVVMEAGDTGNSYGIAVKILHENGLYTYYAHLSQVTVKVGQTVSQNQMIGNVGTSGFVTGSHVHFEVRLPSGTQVNPLQYLIGY